MARLSISKAWEESRALMERDGRLLGSVALALVGLPSIVVTLIAPSTGAATRADPVGFEFVQFLFMVIALVAQLTLVRLALKPPITVGGAIAHSVRRLPIYFGGAFVVALAVIILLLPVAYFARDLGIPIDGRVEEMSVAGSILVIVLTLGFLLVVMRMLMMTPVASVEDGGPLHVIKRSWDLTRQSWGRLFLFVLALIISALAIMMVIQVVVQTLVELTLGGAQPFTVSALLLGIVEGLFNAGFTALFSVMLARIYVQLAGRDSAEAPVSGS